MQYSSLENLALPRRQRVFDKQLVPAGDALPIWTNLPLDCKLPIMPSPKGSYTLYTTTVGEPKYIHHQHYDFDLGNALYARPGEYDSLHDPYLKDYFYRPHTRRLLLHNNLITKDSKVKCDIKEFNQYRSYLRYRSVTELSLQRSGERMPDSRMSPRRVCMKQFQEAYSNSRQAASDRDTDSTDRLAMYARDLSLVQRIRMREKSLLKRLSAKEREREREQESWLRDSWQDRKQRQRRLLQHEQEVDRRSREERMRQIALREKTLARQRDRPSPRRGNFMQEGQGPESRERQSEEKRKDKEDEKEAKDKEQEARSKETDCDSP